MNVDEFYDLSPLQMYTLLILSEHGSCTMRELARQQKIVPASMTAQIDRLVKKGLIERTNDKTDGRIVRVQMSDEGKEKLKQLYTKKHEETKQILSILTQEEQEALVASMKKIEAHFLTVLPK